MFRPQVAQSVSTILVFERTLWLDICLRLLALWIRMLIPVCIHSTGSHSGAASRPFGPPTAPRLKWKVEIRKPLNLEGHCSRHDTNSLLQSCVGHALGSDLFKHDTENAENEINVVRTRVTRHDACNSTISCNLHRLVRHAWILLLEC